MTNTSRIYLEDQLRFATLRVTQFEESLGRQQVELADIQKNLVFYRKAVVELKEDLNQ